MMRRGGILLHPGSRLWLGTISDPAKRSPRGGIASPTQCLSRKRQGWVKRSADPTPANSNMCWVIADARPNLRLARGHKARNDGSIQLQPVHAGVLTHFGDHLAYQRAGSGRVLHLGHFRAAPPTLAHGDAAET